MTSYRLMDGVSGRPGVGSSGTQPPSAPTSYSGNYIAGLVFEVTGTVWLEGFWWWVPAGGDTSPVKCALWQPGSLTNDFGVGTLVYGSQVTSGTLTAGQWNYIPLPQPMLLSQNGYSYVAALGYATTIGFPDTQNQFGAGNPYASGITNGPLTAPPTNVSFGLSQQPYSTASADPGAVMPASNDQNDLLWLDVQVTDTPPAGASYRLWPNLPYAVGDGTNGGVSIDTDGYTMATQFSLTEQCMLGRIWFYSAYAQFGGSAAVAIPTRCAIWDVSSQTVVPGTDNAAVSWKKPDGSTGAAGDGWVYCDYSGAGVTLAAGHGYKTAVWYAGGSVWRTVDQGYWSTGLGTAGIVSGPLSAPNTANATPGQDSWNGPNLAWAYPGTYSNPENDWVDVEVIPAAGLVPPLISQFSGLY